MAEIDDIFDSKIKRLRIELPHYSFGHSSSEESQDAFIGRKQILKRLRKLIEIAADKTGVYLVTGNRGVGKTRLVNHVINQTSLQPNSNFIKNFKYSLILLFSVFIVQLCTQKFRDSEPVICLMIFGGIFLPLFIILCCHNGYNRCRESKHNTMPEVTFDFIKHSISSVVYAISSIRHAIKELTFLINPHYPYKKTYSLKIILVVSGVHFFSIISHIIPIVVLIGYIILIFVFMFCRFVQNKWHEHQKNEQNKALEKSFLCALLKNHSEALRWLLLSLILREIIHNYLKNRSRLYLRINFGHRLKDEKDILRLITRTLSTEYSKYHRSFPRLFFWRVTAFGLLLLSTHLFLVNGGGAYVDYLVAELADINKIGSFFSGMQINITYERYRFVLSFFSIYLFTVLLFHSDWLAHFFVTHRMIGRQLKRLNSDITYSTERENSVNLKGEREGIGIGIGSRIKRTRNIADAREIEKELQDILDNIQQIPIFMCRPDIVIVFDELDKIEVDEIASEKGSQKTKASLFSIDSTRKRQTETLRILSNMKYFLSTAKAKFIFIAGREMYDIYLADVSERSNYIGSIFNAVIYVPSFFTDHSEGAHADMTSLTEEFVCRRLIPHNYREAESYNLKEYRIYLEEKIFKDVQNERQEIQKIIAVLQQFVIYLAHLSKGAPKKMMQLFESFIEVRDIGEQKDVDEPLVVQRYHNSQLFLSFDYYKQSMLGIIAYLITPIFNYLSESNIKEHSDKLLVSSLRFVDFLFKFHRYSFSWENLDISPEMLEVNRAPELKTVAVDLLNYLAKVHISRSNFSLYDYKFDALIANEIFAMTKTDENFSALVNFSLDETLPLKKHYQDMLEKVEKEYQSDKNSAKFIDAISSLQVVLGDLHFYDDQLEEAEVYYKNAVHALRSLETSDDKKDDDMTLEELYLYVRNMLKLAMVYEKQKRYDFAYLTYGELCKRIIRERNITFKELKSGVVLRKNKKDEIVFVRAKSIDKNEKKYYDNIEIPRVSFLSNFLRTTRPICTSIARPHPLYFKDISPNTNDMLFKKMTYEGLKQLYLPFIAKLQILEKSHVDGITSNHLEHLEKEFEFLTSIIDHTEAKLLEADFFSRVADIIYYKNSDLKNKKKKRKRRRKKKNYSCTACYYYHKALSILLNLDKIKNGEYTDTVIKLLSTSAKQIYENYNMKYCMILARILSDWGNVFFSCNKRNRYGHCFLGNISPNDNKSRTVLEACIGYMESESQKENRYPFLGELKIRRELEKDELKKDEGKLSKMEIAFAMYTISLHAYRKANLYRRSAYQIYKMLRLFKYYKAHDKEWIDKLSKKAIQYLLYANENLNMFELNKRKKDFGRDITGGGNKGESGNEGENKNGKWYDIPLQYLLIDSEIIRIAILTEDLKLKLNKTSESLKNCYDLYIASPYGINYSITAHIYRLRFKSVVNYEAYDMLVYNKEYEGKRKEFWEKNYNTKNKLETEIKFILEKKYCDKTIIDIFGKCFALKDGEDVAKDVKVDILTNLIADSIFCFKEIISLSKTTGETHLFNHSFMGSMHGNLSFWIRRYEIFEKKFSENSSKINELLKKYLGKEWEKQLSAHYETKQALSHYYKCLEMHEEGRAYHNMINDLCYIKDDYNDRSDHFSIAEERHNILNGKIKSKINKLKKFYEDSGLYEAKKYYEKNLVQRKL